MRKNNSPSMDAWLAEAKAQENASKIGMYLTQTYQREGIYYIRVWLNQGVLSVGDDIMYVLIGGDIRPRVVAALEELVGRIKRECVTETELYANNP